MPCYNAMYDENNKTFFFFLKRQQENILLSGHVWTVIVANQYINIVPHDNIVISPKLSVRVLGHLGFQQRL